MLFKLYKESENRIKIKKTYGLKRERVMRLFHTKHNTQKTSTWEEQFRGA